MFLQNDDGGRDENDNNDNNDNDTAILSDASLLPTANGDVPVIAGGVTEDAQDSRNWWYCGRMQYWKPAGLIMNS